MKKVLAVNFMALAFVMLFLSSCGDRTFEKQYLESTKEVHELLSKNGMCSTLAECRSKSLFFWDLVLSGTGFASYGITDEKVLEEISQVLIRKFLATPDMKKLVFTAYMYPHDKTPNKKLFNLSLRR